MENHNFLADKPVNSQVEDRFQRYSFSKRIAETIVSRANNDSLVIGIYGAWGEGKTSVLNFIEKELLNDTETLIIKFNPWRYTDEDTLLINFLSKIAVLLGKKPKTTKQQAGDWLEMLGGLGGLFGADMSGTGKILATIDIEELKKRVDTFLKEKKKRLVIFIDDIDRLDKQEIYSIFRLVKLNGDFSNTTYILSFDEEMVASAIGDRFGEGNKAAGDNFLEKIVQVPLIIPKAQKSVLRDYCFDLVNKAVNSSGIELTDQEARRYAKVFTESILLRLATPRLAVRYGNALSFALPLLKGEANMVDLMLIEAIKVFYPNHYNLVKSEPELFVDTYLSGSLNTKEKRKKEIAENLDKLGKDLSEKENKAIKNLLTDLFPFLRYAFDNYGYSDSSYETWYRDKRITSGKYFERYFSYTVLEGDISDVDFGKFIDELRNLSLDQAKDRIINFITETSDEKFIEKLRNYENLNWDSGKKLALILCLNSNLFTEKSTELFGAFNVPRNQAAIFIYQIIKDNPDKSDRFEFAKRILSETTDINFAFTVNEWYRTGDTPEERMFTTEQYREIFELLLDRSIRESNPVSIFEKYAFNVSASAYLIHTWAELDRSGLDEYVKVLLESNPEKVLDVIKSLTMSSFNTEGVEAFKTTFKAERYRAIKRLFDVKYLYSKIEESYGVELSREELFWDDLHRLQNDLNILRQFVYWYKHDNEISS